MIVIQRNKLGAQKEAFKFDTNVLDSKLAVKFPGLNHRDIIVARFKDWEAVYPIVLDEINRNHVFREDKSTTVNHKWFRTCWRPDFPVLLQTE